VYDLRHSTDLGSQLFIGFFLLLVPDSGELSFPVNRSEGMTSSFQLESSFCLQLQFRLPAGPARNRRALRFCRWHSVVAARQGRSRFSHPLTPAIWFASVSKRTKN